jgi:hypothetical protein
MLLRRIRRHRMMMMIRGPIQPQAGAGHGDQMAQDFRPQRHDLPIDQGLRQPPAAHGRSAFVVHRQRLRRHVVVVGETAFFWGSRFIIISSNSVFIIVFSFWWG